MKAFKREGKRSKGIWRYCKKSEFEDMYYKVLEVLSSQIYACILKVLENISMCVLNEVVWTHLEVFDCPLASLST